ncbi:UMP kinase [archaeon]|jgi:uridylate kinase|nr:UMP kinase [archaeon]MBT3577310.1 UMP kinase [archaeon]MBT6820446.1 UMP kinase [archaeon]MBT6956271.1 UMP kinase [archaeon]MBT7025260.1 UMP kinase [archaeon]
MKKWVMSLGGSQIVPDKVDYKFLKRFRDLIESHPSQKFVVVTGGGSIARKYITALRKLGSSNKKQALTGIAITRLNAGLLAKFFGVKANEIIPKNMTKVKNLLNKNQVVFCGGLRYKKKSTSDGTAAKLAVKLKTPFINITNVKGLYTSNPKTNKNAKFIKKISWKKFDEIASKIKFKAGQHFVLDQKAAKIILKNKVPTYIVGSLDDVDKILQGKKNFQGTIISG